MLEVSDRRVADRRRVPGVWRMTLTHPELRRTRELLWMVTGVDAQMGEVDRIGKRLGRAAASKAWVLRRLVLVVAPEPERLLVFLVTPHRRPVQQPVVGHRGLEAARGGYVGPVDGPV
jgi:hypothetical protein